MLQHTAQVNMCVQGRSTLECDWCESLPSCVVITLISWKTHSHWLIDSTRLSSGTQSSANLPYQTRQLLLRSIEPRSSSLFLHQQIIPFSSHIANSCSILGEGGNRKPKLNSKWKKPTNYESCPMSSRFSSPPARPQVAKRGRDSPWRGE